MIRALARFSVGNPVAVNLATLMVAFGGVMAYLRMPREVFPEFSLGTVTVSTLYPGAAPEDVERLITLPVEEVVEGVDGIDKLRSTSQEGLSVVTITARADVDMPRMVEDIRAAVQSGELELPEDAEDPVVREIKSEFPVIAVHVYGQASDEELRREAERHQRELARIDGVARVILQGMREPRIWVEVDPVALERFGLTLAQVGAAVGGRSTDTPLGSLTTSSGDYLLRVEADVEEAEDLRQLPVVRTPQGHVVRLSELARVREAQARTTTRARFNGASAMYLQVNKAESGDTLSIAKTVWQHVADESPNTPPGIALGANSDMSVYIENRLRVMQESALLGGALVLISLLLFLDLRFAAMTAIGIPISFLGCLLMAYSIGISMNMMTMFALIIVLGMVVDDAIVVGENIFRHVEDGLPPTEAAVRGTIEVGKPVVATILTTIAAFLPTFAIGGTMGEFMRPLPIVVTLCLIASLLEALGVLPSHLAHWKARPRGEGAEERRWYDPLRDAYVRVLKVMVVRRYLVLFATAVGIFLLAGVGIFRLSFVLFDDFESQVFSVNMRLGPGASIEESFAAGEKVEAVIGELPAEELASTNLIAGVSYQDASRFTIAQNLAQVWVELHEGEDRKRPTSVVIEELRQRFDPPPPGVEHIEITQPQAGPTGRAIDIAVRGENLASLEVVAGRLEEKLAGYRGVRDVRDDWEPGKREVLLSLTEAGRFLGFDERLLGRELRTAFEGTRFARVRRGEDDVEVHVKLPEELRSMRGALERLPVTVPAGGAPVALGLVAELNERTGPSVITRQDGARAIRVTADVNKAEGNAKLITEEVLAGFDELRGEHTDVGLALGGEQEDAAKAMDGIGESFLMALLAIYLILGTLFRSFTLPLVTMTAIPFGIVGMIGGHALMDRPLSFMSLIGFVALSGIVVNDSLILMEFVNQRRREGAEMIEAVIVAGRQRFRPILLTSITTMLGLSPLTFFASGQARFLQPMAITVFFGLFASTFLILIVVPCAHLVHGDLGVLWRRVRRLPEPSA